MAQFTFVRNAIQDAAGLSLEFAENNGGDTLFAAFVAVDLLGAFGDPPPSTLVDSNNNTWTLAVSRFNRPAAIANFISWAIYYCEKCQNSSGANTLDGTTVFTDSGSVLSVWVIGVEFFTPFANITFDTYDEIDGSSSTDASISYTQGVDDALILCGVFDADLNTFTAGVMANPPNTPTTSRNEQVAVSAIANSNGIFGAFETLIANNPQDLQMSIASATDAFSFAASFGGTNATGGSAAETLTFSLNKGPDPTIPIEGRAIATVQIDCTQQLSHLFTAPIDFPEYANYGDIDNSPKAFVVIDFDLEHLFQGSGLSQVRTLMAWSRPQFVAIGGVPPREDSADMDAIPFFPALLTNLTTLQTVVLGGSAVRYNNGSDVADGQKSYGESLIYPFPANKHSLKYRFIAPQNQNAANIPIGKYTLQFCNWEIPPMLTCGVIAETPD
jgi:hypothetical protein